MELESAIFFIRILAKVHERTLDLMLRANPSIPEQVGEDSRVFVEALELGATALETVLTMTTDGKVDASLCPFCKMPYRATTPETPS